MDNITKLNTKEKIKIIDDFLCTSFGHTGWNRVMTAARVFDNIYSNKKFSIEQQIGYKRMCDMLDNVITKYDLDQSIDALYECITWYNNFGKLSTEAKINSVEMNGQLFKLNDIVFDTRRTHSVKIDANDLKTIKRFVYLKHSDRMFFVSDESSEPTHDLMHYTLLSRGI